ncbi:MAG: hypothetical protein ABIQ90_03510, partial [Polaromonas sp.]
GQPLGLMLHHAQMDDGELALLGHWLAALASHPRARWRSMRSLPLQEAGRVCSAVPHLAV